MNHIQRAAKIPLIELNGTKPTICVHGDSLRLPHDCMYTEDRNSCIEAAEKLTIHEVDASLAITSPRQYRHQWAVAFLTHMDAEYARRFGGAA